MPPSDTLGLFDCFLVLLKICSVSLHMYKEHNDPIVFDLIGQ